ncbi:hypothetical protein LSTR_LSTR003918 [Laodelphax striatellus]|uniref:Uncharacterized protein n=1 Tax=Laodelphax striatellus TaxID=195883 RepID=A0A482X9X9_LAOST|nr:hypothetical protein LSTR_LSTR003918 [Laodelphax striatellus]
MESSKKTLAALLLVTVLVAVTAYPQPDPPAGGAGGADAGGAPGDKGGSGAPAKPSGGGGGECSQQKVCKGSLAKIDISAKIGAGICLLDSLTKKLLFFKNKCQRNMYTCSNKSAKYQEVESNKCGSS